MYLNDVVVGIDVASDSFVAAVLAPNGDVSYKPKKFDMNKKGFEAFILVLQEQEKLHNSRPKIFLESTGIYHRQLFFTLINEGFESYLINPLALKHITINSLRKVKNDANDAVKIALACKQLNIPTCYIPDAQTEMLRGLARTYYSLTDNKAMIKIKLTNELHSIFPGFTAVFSDLTSNTPLKLLELCATPKQFLETEEDEIMSLLKTYSRKGLKWAQNKFNLLNELAQVALSNPASNFVMDISIKTYLALLQQLDIQITNLINQLENVLDINPDFSLHRKSIELLQSLPGVGFISAVALIAELGDLTRFKSAKQLVAFLGIDPSVNESGKFKGDRNRMSKRGSVLGRRILFTVALASIRTNRSKEPINSVLRDYYLEKCKSKKKKVAIGAVMNKLTRYLFAVLRNRVPYQMVESKIHAQKHHALQFTTLVA